MLAAATPHVGFVARTLANSIRTHNKLTRRSQHTVHVATSVSCCSSVLHTKFYLNGRRKIALV